MTMNTLFHILGILLVTYSMLMLFKVCYFEPNIFIGNFPNLLDAQDNNVIYFLFMGS